MGVRDSGRDYCPVRIGRAHRLGIAVVVGLTLRMASCSMIWAEIPFVGEKTPESVVEIIVGFIAGIIFDYGYNEPGWSNLYSPSSP